MYNSTVEMTVKTSAEIAPTGLSRLFYRFVLAAGNIFLNPDNPRLPHQANAICSQRASVKFPEITRVGRLGSEWAYRAILLLQLTYRSPCINAPCSPTLLRVS